MSQKTYYLYLHGFASSPQSIKAQYLRDRFAELQVNLSIPDLNQDNFSAITLTRQIKQVADEFLNLQQAITIIASSFGGLTAAWLGQQFPQVQRLVLLAPALGFIRLWLTQLGETEVKQWQASGYLMVYHYGMKRSLPLGYQFVEDTSQYEEHQLQRPVPTLILHGCYDEIIPIEASRDYARQRPWVELREQISDHSLTNVMPQIWQAIQDFCDL